MLSSAARLRLVALAARSRSPSFLRPLSSSSMLSNQTSETAVNPMGTQDQALQESEQQTELQAPNRPGIWSRNQQERAVAMTGPRFEQTVMETQPQPFAAIELIHKQPVRWVDTKVVACDGGGGPLGHPKVFINTDKPQVCVCGYCGLPYAHTHHRKYLESLPSTPYPLKPSGDPAEVRMPQTLSQFGEIDGQAAELTAERVAESVDGKAFEQR